MNVADNFSQRVVVHSTSIQWLNSPTAGVDRRPLDRVGDEVARATTIVRYAANSQFPPHIHTGGEEFIVLEGVFQDEHGDFPVGSYIRNPPQSKHQPGSEKGCVIFVKLWQFQPDDRAPVNLQTNIMENTPHANFKGVSVTPLFKDIHEEVSLLHIKANAEFSLKVNGGGELLVLEGSLTEQADILYKHSWLRSPVDSEINIKAGNDGATIWIKTGHLVDVDNQIARVQSV